MESDMLRNTRHALVEYRIPLAASILVAALASTFVLGSQSASSFATYLLGIYVLANVRQWRALFLDWGFLAVAALLVYLPLTSLWSTPWDARDAFSEVVRAVLVFAFVVCLAECLQVDWFRQRMTWAVAVFGAAAAVAAMWFFFTVPPEDGRLNGLGQLDTHVAAGMVFAVAAISGLAWLLQGDSPRPGWTKAVAFLSVGVLAMAVALTGSRNAMACGAFGIAALLVAHRTAGATTFAVRMIGLAIAGSAALIAAYFFLPGADTLVLPRGDSHRLAIWTYYAERIAAEGTWFGLGILTDDVTEMGGLPVLHPHNLFLAVVWQGGVAGLALMLLVVGTTLATFLRHFAAAEAKLGLAIWALALPGYLIDGHELVDKIGWTWLLFWLPVAIGVGLRARHALPDARRFGTFAGPTT